MRFANLILSRLKNFQARFIKANDSFRKSGLVKVFNLRVRAMMCLVDDWVQQRSKNEVIPLPPPLLRYRVHGALEAPGFIWVGNNCANDIKNMLNSMNRDLYSFNNILDFGCGCGHVLRFFHDHPGTCHFYGTDIDGEAIKWCQKNIKIAFFNQNEPDPPISSYQDDYFDLIYGISVFTHIDETMQFKWLSELKRIASPGGILILSVSGEKSRGTWDFPEQDKPRLAENGIIFYVTQTGRYKLDGLPDFYQHTVHTKEYVMREWSKYFNILSYIEAGINNHQDAVILMKNA